MRVVVSYNKAGPEGEWWSQEIRKASTGETEFLPFNHGTYVDPARYMDAWALDRLYRAEEPALRMLYTDLGDLLRRQNVDALLVTNCPPYHPGFLRTLGTYRALFSTDDPDSTYRRTVPYLHAYDHVFYCDPLYGREMDMPAMMQSCGVKAHDWLPLGVFDFERDAAKTADEVVEAKRDIDVVYVGAFWRQKLPLLAEVAKSLGRRFCWRGYFTAKQNLYLNARYGCARWIGSVTYGERVRLYERAKIGINIHWDEFGLGNQRLYHLPANGVMQLTDCAQGAGRIFEIGKEVETYRGAAELLEKIQYFLDHESERLAIARAGYERVMVDYRIPTVLAKAVEAMRRGMLRRERAG